LSQKQETITADCTTKQTTPDKQITQMNADGSK